MNTGNIFKKFMLYAVSYIKSSILVFVVLPSLFAVIFIWTAFNSTLELNWIKYLSFIDPKYGTGTFHINISDVMKIFGIVSLVFFCITELLKLAGIKIKISFKFGVLILSFIFAFAEFLTLFPTNTLSNRIPSSASIFSSLFILFYAITLLAYFMWHKLDTHN